MLKVRCHPVVYFVGSYRRKTAEFSNTRTGRHWVLLLNNYLATWVATGVLVQDGVHARQNTNTYTESPDDCVLFMELSETRTLVSQVKHPQLLFSSSRQL